MTIELTAPAVPVLAYDGEPLPIHTQIVVESCPSYNTYDYDVNLYHAFRTLDTDLKLDITGLNVVAGDN